MEPTHQKICGSSGRRTPPGITSDEDRIRGAEAAGYTVTSIMRHPMKTWEDYYRPVAARINEWREICGSRNNRIPAGYGKEIEIFRTYGSYYGYTFFTLKKD